MRTQEAEVSLVVTRNQHQVAGFLEEERRQPLHLPQVLQEDSSEVLEQQPEEEEDFLVTSQLPQQEEEVEACLADQQIPQIPVQDLGFSVAQEEQQLQEPVRLVAQLSLQDSLLGKAYSIRHKVKASSK